MALVSEIVGVAGEAIDVVKDIGSFIGGLFSGPEQNYSEFREKYLSSWISKGGTSATLAVAAAYNYPNMSGIPSSAFGVWRPGSGVSLFPNADHVAIVSGPVGSGLSGGKWSGSDIPGADFSGVSVASNANGGIVGSFANTLDTTQGDVIADEINRWLGRATENVRTIKTDNTQLYIIAAVVLAAVFILKK